MLLRGISRTSVSNLIVKRNFIVTSKSSPTPLKISLKKYVKLTLFGATVVYGYNNLEVCGGLTRFLRSIKIAALISTDYLWNLHGLEDGTEIYKQVAMYIVSSGRETNIQSSFRLSRRLI